MKTIAIAALILFVSLSGGAFAANIDGVVSAGEYTRDTVFDNGNFKLSWDIQGDKVFVAIDAKTNGWVAIGFDPSVIMANADMVFGYLDQAGKAQAVDAWSTGMFGPHPPDTNLGGRDDILSYAVKRTGDRVVFEFSRLLSTGDKFDKVIPKTGNFKILWAYGPNASLDSKHSRSGSAVLNMDAKK